MNLHKAVKITNTAKKITNDPLGFIFDTIVTIVLNLVVPVPLLGTVISAFRAPILGFLASLVILLLFMLIAVGVMLFSPILIPSQVIQNITSTFQDNSLHIAPDTSFLPASIPRQNPMGGSGMDFTNVTAYFNDPNYFLRFGLIHTGLDLVPSDNYYKNSKTWQQYHKVVAFATINGTARAYIDQYGGETVEITNSSNSLREIYIHFSTTLAQPGQISPGTPVGIMGQTGFATGEHVHYEIQLNENGNWVPVNPLNYIQ